MKANIARETQYDHRIAHAWHLQPRSKTRFETHAGDNISNLHFSQIWGYTAAELRVWMAPRRFVN
jgi:hypothetical protein